MKSKKKVMIPVRVEIETYNKIQDKVCKEKKKNRSFSINKYINQLLEKNMKEE